MAYTKYSLTPANNNAAPPDGAPEGMLPSAVNDTMRDMMAQIRDVGDGIRGGTYTMTAPVITGGSVTGVTSVSTSGNLTFTGTGNRIRGDFSNATQTNRVAFQTSTTNGSTIINAIPNGTATQSQWEVFNASDPTNAARGQFLLNASELSVRSQIAGTGSYVPLTMYTGGSERLRIDTSGNVGIGTTSPATKLHVKGVWVNGEGQFQIDADSGQQYSGLTIQNNGTVKSYLFHDNTNSFVELQSSNELRLNVNTANALKLYTNDTERMRIDTSGNVGIGTTATAGQQLTVASSGSSAAANAFYVSNSTPVVLFTIRNDGVIFSGTAPASPYNLTTASAANMFVDSGGVIYRSTSSLRYKKNVQDYGKGLSDIAKLRPVTFTSKPKDGEENSDTNTYAGFIAEEVHEAGLTEFVHYNNEGHPDALSYANMTALLTKAIQEQQALIENLTTRLNALEGK